MYNAIILAERIKTTAKSKGFNLGGVLKACDLGINTVSKISKGNDVMLSTIAKIADYLDVSVDYLLGRTGNPEVNK
ncbi:MAG: helix-turn-helix domain-containing protein [Candidatus Fimenecus sp.]